MKRSPRDWFRRIAVLDAIVDDAFIRRTNGKPLRRRVTLSLECGCQQVRYGERSRLIPSRAYCQKHPRGLVPQKVRCVVQRTE